MLSCLVTVTAVRSGFAASGGDLSEIKQLRTTQFLDSAKRQALKDWIAAQAKDLLSEDLSLSEKHRIRQVFNEALQGQPAPSVNFRENFIKATVEVFSEHLADGDPTGTLVMAMILYDFREQLAGLPGDQLRECLSQQGGMLTALSNPVPAVKYWVARTIRFLHPKIADLPGPRRAVVEALRKAGMEETNGLALREIYLALDFSKTMGKNIDFGPEIAAALVDIFDARGEDYATAKVDISDGDVAGLSAMSRMSGPMTSKDEAELRTRYLTALSRMLCRIADSYTVLLATPEGADLDRKEYARRMLVVCQAVEEEMTRLAKDAKVGGGKLPSLYQKMRGGIKEELDLERNQWCGWPPDTKGVLNDKSLGVPIGAGYPELKQQGSQPPADTTQPKQKTSEAKSSDS